MNHKDVLRSLREQAKFQRAQRFKVDVSSARAADFVDEAEVNITYDGNSYHQIRLNEQEAQQLINKLQQHFKSQRRAMQLVS